MTKLNTRKGEVPTLLAMLVVGVVLMSGCMNIDKASDSKSDTDTFQKSQKSRYSLSECQSKKTNIERTGCYSEAAAAKGDPSICKNLDDYVLGMNNCYNEVAQAEKDESICMMIGGEHPQTICLGRVGKQKNDPSVCENLKTDIWKKQCVSIVNE